MLSDGCPVCDVGVLWPNGWIDQYEPWHADRPRPWPHCVRWGPSYLTERGTVAPPSSIFTGAGFACIRIIRGLCLLWPNAWTVKMPLGMEVGLGQSHIVLDGDPAPLRQKGHSSPPPQFLAHVYCGQTAGWIKMRLGMEEGLGPGDILLDGDSAPTTERGTAAPTFRPISIVAKRSPISATAELLYKRSPKNLQMVN